MPQIGPQKLSILIIDDEEEVIEYCNEYVESMECFKNIISATDGIQATSKLANQEFNVVVMDVNMPKKDAFGIVKSFKEIQDKTIIMSGGLGAIAVKRLVSLGVKHFLVKPFDQKNLCDKINLILNSQNL